MSHQSQLERVLISTNASPSSHELTQCHYYLKKIVVNWKKVIPKFEKSFHKFVEHFETNSLINNASHFD